MILAIAFLEGSVVFATVSAALLLWPRPPALGRTALALTLTHALGLSLCILAALVFADMYSARRIRSVQAVLRRMPRAFATSALLTATFATLIPTAPLTASPLEVGLLLTIGVLFGPLLIFRTVATHFVRRRPITRLLIVGTDVLARRLMEQLERRPDWQCIATDAEEGSSLDEIIEGVQPHRIAVALNGRGRRLPVRELLTARVCRGIPIHDCVDLYERVGGKLAIETLPSSHLICSDGFLRSRAAEAARRGVHVLIAALGLIVSAPLFMLVALAIRLDSGGPVLFRQRRLGLNGKPFVLLKFRTMYPAPLPTSEWERDNRHRVTRVGKWLRKCWLDELPQLVNVLRGDMNLVGPRPHPVSNLELFVLVSRNAPECGEPIPYYSLRCMVRPGVTGWAQVRYGYANDLDEEIEKLRYDLYYIKHRSLWFDLRILMETLRVILSGRDSDLTEAPAPETSRSAPFPTGAPRARPRWMRTLPQPPVSGPHRRAESAVDTRTAP